MVVLAIVVLVVTPSVDVLVVVGAVCISDVVLDVDTVAACVGGIVVGALVLPTVVDVAIGVIVGWRVTGTVVPYVA